LKALAVEVRPANMAAAEESNNELSIDSKFKEGKSVMEQNRGEATFLFLLYLIFGCMCTTNFSCGILSALTLHLSRNSGSFSSKIVALQRRLIIKVLARVLGR
jgi:hypothetical protein